MRLYRLPVAIAMTLALHTVAYADETPMSASAKSDIPAADVAQPVMQHDMQGMTHDMQHMQHAEMGAKKGASVEKIMEKMKVAYRDALRSQSLEELAPAAAQLNALASQTRASSYGKKPATQKAYQDGMQKLSSALDELNRAIAAKDFAAAQNVLKTQIKMARNESHQALNVH